jgi:hypothetical protein
MRALKVKFLAAFVTVFVLMLTVGLFNTLRADDRLARCGAGAGGGNEVAAAFEIPAASQIWNFLPALGISPELAENNAPAYVVVFAGEFRIAEAGAPGNSGVKSLTDAVCVIREGMEPLWYSEVSRAGFQTL